MQRLDGFCRIATTFAPDGALDEAAFWLWVQRFVDADIGVYLGSAGSGEGNALTPDELLRVYQIGVETCRGKIPVHGNPPEAQTVRATREHTLLAIEGGCEMVNVYGPTGWHSYRPTEDEFLGFFDDLLATIRHPIALAPNPTMGYTPKPEWIIAICRKHTQVAAVNLVGLGDDYLIRLQDGISRTIAYNVPLSGSLNMIGLGAAG